MKDTAPVLLVSEQDEVAQALRKVLEAQGVKTQLVRNIAQANAILEQDALPAAVFSDAVLTDGTWADVVFLAAQARMPVPVIVVSRINDMRLYIRALENGAADFIVPPFAPPEIAHVLRCATGNGEKTAGHHALIAKRNSLPRWLLQQRRESYAVSLTVGASNCLWPCVA